MFPEAEVEAKQVKKRPITVKIEADGAEIIEVDQRDLFGKYGWPAEKEINEALTKLKKQMTGAE